MRRQGDAIILSATDLMRFQGCAHAVALDLRELKGERLIPAEDSAGARLIQAKGHAHEAAFLQSLKDAGKSVHTIDKDSLSFEDALAQTRHALAEGADYICQAALAGGRWSGYADFLERVGQGASMKFQTATGALYSTTRRQTRARPKTLAKLTPAARREFWAARRPGRRDSAGCGGRI